LSVSGWKEQGSPRKIKTFSLELAKEPTMHNCLLVIDVQESFPQRPYWDKALASPYLAQQNALIEGAVARGIPVVRVLHTDGPDDASNPFAPSSGHIRPLNGLVDFPAAATITKHRHSALVGTELPVWLTQNHIQRIIVSGIRTEQCCETTTRHASDLGWTVDYVLDATLTFDMTQPNGEPLRAADIKARTATVLDGRFARVCSVAQALEEVHA
jgi:nicotinamidase-related amidase